MLAYPINEAETLLESKLKSAQDNLANCEEDLDFLREQITVRPEALLSPGRGRAVATDTDRCGRLWKSRPRESTTGTLRCGGKRREGEMTKGK